MLLTTDGALASLVHVVQIQAVLLSRNSLTSLQGIQQFAAARTVSLAANLLESYDDLAPLIRGCPALEALSLEGNPLSALPNYRCLGRHACQGRDTSSGSADPSKHHSSMQQQQSPLLPVLAQARL